MASPELRLRPRDGAPERPVEHLAQFAWKWRSEIVLAYIALAVSVAVAIGMGWI